MSVVVSPDDGGTDRYGKKVSELQSGIKLHTSTYYGTLKYQDNYDIGLGEGKDKGYFFSLKFDNKGEHDIWTKLTNADRNDFVKVDDGFCVYRVTDPKKQHVIVQYRDGNTVLETQDYTLYGLELQGSK